VQTASETKSSTIRGPYREKSMPGGRLSTGCTDGAGPGCVEQNGQVIGPMIHGHSVKLLSLERAAATGRFGKQT
jgi:hypothetical protein